MPLFESFDVMTPAAWKECRCSTHECALIRTATGWTCPKGLSCTAIIPDYVLMERVSRHLKLSTNPETRVKQLKAAFAEIKGQGKQFLAPPNRPRKP